MNEHAAVHESEWHTSYWPFIMSVGILFLLPLSFGFYFVYENPFRAVLSLGIGAPLTLISIAGWVKEGIEDKHNYSMGHSILAMPFFIVAEVFLFLGFFAAYWVMRLLAPSWPPAGTPEMPVLVPVIMTIILVSSSFTIHMAEVKMENNQHGGFVGYLLATILLGTLFLGFSMHEWNELFHEGFNFKTNAYSTAFYSITGFHGSHVLVGVCIFLSAFIPALARKVSKPFLKAASIYWHFVDIIWLFVVTQVYFW